MNRGRPLRFLALLLLGWVGVRVAILAPDAAFPPTAAVTVPHVAQIDRPLPIPAALRPAQMPSPVAAWTRRQRVTGRVRADAMGARSIAPAISAGRGGGAPLAAVPPSTVTVPITAPLPALTENRPARARRLRVDGWLIVRGRGSGSALTPQLGGSQAGMRISYRMGDAAAPALFVRASQPLDAGAREVAAGVQWSLRAVPLTLLAEVRKVEGQPAAAAVGAFGGIDRALGRVRLSGYGQAGYAAGRAATFYADGQARLALPVARFGPIDLDAGVGSWVAAQRRAHRLDLGPSVSAILPLGPGTARLGLDWRLRVVGRARPGSGPALTLAAGF